MAPYERFSAFRLFLDISLGSLAELGYAIRLTADLGFLDQAVFSDLMELHTRASRATWHLYASMRGR
jgi:four helix bundle protein